MQDFDKAYAELEALSIAHKSEALKLLDAF